MDIAAGCVGLTFIGLGVALGVLSLLFLVVLFWLLLKKLVTEGL